MRQKYFLSILTIFTVNLILFSCKNEIDEKENINHQSQSEEEFVNTMQKHLNAVTNRDIETLKSTMSPNGEMQLILAGFEIIYSVDGFMDYHEE